MKWEVAICTGIVACIVGVCFKGRITDISWWISILLFWIAMAVRDGFIRAGC